MRGVEAEIGRGSDRQRQLELAATSVSGHAREVEPELDLLRRQLIWRTRAVETHVHALGVTAVEDSLDHPGRPVQRAESRSDDVEARLAPHGVAARLRADAFSRRLALGRGRALDDRLEQARGRANPHQLVDVAQMKPELVVPDRVHARVVLSAEPPEPVAPFGDQDLPPAERSRIRKLRALARLFVQPRPCVRQQFPGDVVLGIPDPRIEAGPNPAARVQVMEVLLRRVLAQEVGDRGGDDVRRGLELRVEGVEEVVAVTRIELPRVLAVEGDDGQVILVALLLPYAP